MSKGTQNLANITLFKLETPVHMLEFSGCSDSEI